MSKAGWLFSRVAGPACATGQGASDAGVDLEVAGSGGELPGTGVRVPVALITLAMNLQLFGLREATTKRPR